MTPIYQTKQGIDGDCFRCCIASLLDLPALDVPHFYNKQSSGGAVTGEALSAMRMWLDKHKLSYAETTFTIPLAILMDGMRRFNPDVWYILTGRNDDGFVHSVVARGSNIEHNPASTVTTGAITKPCRDRTYRVGFIVLGG